jgi:hypothetical protein
MFQDIVMAGVMAIHVVMFFSPAFCDDGMAMVMRTLKDATFCV